MIDTSYNVEQDMIDIVGEFTLHWNLFERHYCERGANPNAIKRIDLSAYEGDLRPYIDAFRETIQRWLYHTEKTPVSDVRVKELLYSESKSKWKTPPEHFKRVVGFVREEFNDINSCLLCVERVRNNLFHGEKAVDTLSHQRQLLTTANELLSHLTSKKRIQEYEMNRKKWDKPT